MRKFEGFMHAEETEIGGAVKITALSLSLCESVHCLCDASCIALLASYMMFRLGPQFREGEAVIYVIFSSSFLMREGAGFV